MKSIILFILVLLSVSLQAQTDEIELWPEGVPGAIDSKSYKEVYENNRIKKVKTPSLVVYAPENPNGTAVVVYPGGGYIQLAFTKEGYKAAEWLNGLGITVFALKYRLPSDEIMEDKAVGPLQDAQAAMRYIRRHADKWQINTQKIGVLGFSAGGHLAATLSTQYDEKVYSAKDKTSAKPDFSILVYPVISMKDEITHKGSRKNLLGREPSQEQIKRFSNELHVDRDTPKAFLVHATNDSAVPVENSIAYYLALKNNNVSAEMHLYQDGKHGFSLGSKGTHQFWTKQCEAWLIENQFIQP